MYNLDHHSKIFPIKFSLYIVASISECLVTRNMPCFLTIQIWLDFNKILHAYFKFFSNFNPLSFHILNSSVNNRPYAWTF